MLTEEEKFKMSRYGINILKSNCFIEESEDRSLPSNTYLVECCDGDDVWFDIVQGLRVPIFDAYYDTVGPVIVKMSWTKGQVNPRLWNNTPKQKSNKK
jgi:hypothetical protein